MSSTQIQFPQELLCDPNSDRAGYFYDKLIGHPHLEEARHEVIEAIAAEVPLIFLLGPPGVGKSTLLRKLGSKLAEEANVIPKVDVNRKNTFMIEAVAEGMKKFDWKDFHKRSLYGLHQSFPDLRVDFYEEGIYYNKERLVVENRLSEHTLRRCLEQCLKKLELAAFVVDEAPHFMKKLSGLEFQDLMDVVKSLASLTNTVYVLVGTYELGALIDQSAQLCRRSHVVHFKRYRAEKPKDIKAFQAAVWSFQKHLPLAEEPKLIERWEDLYLGCFGCIGTLKDWLYRALKAALKENNETLTWEFLEKYQITTSRLYGTIKTIREQEAQIEEKFGQKERAKLRTLLGLKEAQAQEEQKKEAAKETKKGRTGRVGVRKAKRDPVGA